MSYVMVDIEADGPIPGDYSMICFGAVIVEPSLSKTFYGQLRPISEQWQPEALAIKEQFGLKIPLSTTAYSWHASNHCFSQPQPQVGDGHSLGLIVHNVGIFAG